MNSMAISKYRGGCTCYESFVIAADMIHCDAFEFINDAE